MRCPKCSEPWDLDSLHDVVEERFPDEVKAYRALPRGTSYESRKARDDVYAALFDQVSADFRRRGCEALGSRHNDTEANPAIGALYELLGDDIDGADALIEDFGL